MQCYVCCAVYCIYALYAVLIGIVWQLITEPCAEWSVQSSAVKRVHFTSVEQTHDLTWTHVTKCYTSFRINEFSSSFAHLRAAPLMILMQLPKSASHTHCNCNSAGATAWISHLHSHYHLCTAGWAYRAHATTCVQCLGATKIQIIQEYPRCSKTFQDV